MIQRAYIVIRGAVQGVGFRPFVYRLATELRLDGWVLNSGAGVFIEVQGERELLETFLLRLEAERPARSFIQSLEHSYLDPVDLHGFEIRASRDGGALDTLVLPDIAVCPECLADIMDHENRRYRYPFTNCTNCGPRFSIIESLPYDRANTSMNKFAMCPDCRREYEDPGNRRFHAQPNACPVCGPRLELWDEAGAPLSAEDEALRAAADAVRAGKIVAVKGLGGFHLMVDARNREAVERLRTRKRREEKPLALMYPGVDAVRHDCEVSRFEERLLHSPEAPIVLLRRSGGPGQTVTEAVAPGNPYLGAMVPYTPLHYLMMRDLAFPVVATSGNLSDEPICTDEHEALERLHGIADRFLVHDRPIVRHVDDSIVRVMLGRELVLRRARGYAPLPLQLKQRAPAMLAVGAHLKNAVAMSVRNNIFISQHIGDLDTPEACAAFQRVIASLQDLYLTQPEAIVSDLHPDYLSTRFAGSLGHPVIAVQHHYAHIAACMAENDLDGRVLGVAWDGTGYGLDGTIWGGEFLEVDGSPFRRAAAFRRFRLPGGTSAVKEPRRSALGVLYEIFGDSIARHDQLAPMRSFSQADLPILCRMLARGVNSPLTSSAGRLFDAVASITGLRQKTSFEGQAAMELEFAISEGIAGASYPFTLGAGPAGDRGADPAVVDWAPAILALLDDMQNGVPAGVVSARFHRTLAEFIVAVAEHTSLERVVLSGGCFQNCFLTECAVQRLEAAGFRPYWHQRIPPNDGGIAVGQIAAALRSQPRSE